MNDERIERAYELAREAYAAHGVDTEAAIQKLKAVPLSLHCWQGDDVGGFERAGGNLSGSGLQVTGAFPGKPRTIEEFRADLRRAFSLIPGTRRLNLHAIYGEFGRTPVDRDAIGPEHFRGWMQWARGEGLKLDFNSTCFAHPLAASGFTLSHRDSAVRRFWIDHVRACRSISAVMGRELGSPCLHNLWIPDGSKEVPADRSGPRSRLRDALDEIFTEAYPPQHMRDSLESKLFGIGSESYVVGSHEFYLGYAVAKQKLICLDMGHFHPTESVADKVSAILLFAPGIVFHLSRGVRWDSDHVVTLNDDLLSVAEEIVRAAAPDRTFVALDYFDGGINRIGAWVAGARAALRAILFALLLPEARLREAEAGDRGLDRLVLREEARALPFGAVWDAFCVREGVPPGADWLADVRAYEKEVLAVRNGED
jgi:L-rhamnose isomerase